MPYLSLYMLQPHTGVVDSKHCTEHSNDLCHLVILHVSLTGRQNSLQNMKSQESRS